MWLFFIIREKKRLKPSWETAQSIDFRREESIFYSFLPPRKKGEKYANFECIEVLAERDMCKACRTGNYSRSLSSLCINAGVQNAERHFYETFSFLSSPKARITKALEQLILKLRCDRVDCTDYMIKKRFDAWYETTSQTNSKSQLELSLVHLHLWTYLVLLPSSLLLFNSKLTWIST